MLNSELQSLPWFLRICYCGQHFSSVRYVKNKGFCFVCSNLIKRLKLKKINFWIPKQTKSRPKALNSMWLVPRASHILNTQYGVSKHSSRKVKIGPKQQLNNFFWYSYVSKQQQQRQVFPSRAPAGFWGLFFFFLIFCLFLLINR